MIGDDDVMHFVLVPGAGGAAWYWHRVVPLLEAAGHSAVAVELPGDDESAGLPEYVALTSAAARGHTEVVLVGQSLGGFTVPVVAARLVDQRQPPRRIALVNAMIPLPGETAGDWWDHVAQSEARIAAAAEGGWPVAFDLEAYFLHDVDPEVAAAGEAHQRPESDAVFAAPCEIDAWPDVPAQVISGADDRFFPLAFQRRVARDRLDGEPVVIPGGHLVALSQPAALVAALIATD